MIHKSDEDPNWFYVHEGRREGPFDRRGLIQALLARDAPEKILVWRSGLSHWMRAGDVQELRLELPPPIPKDAVPRERADGAEPPPVPADAGKAGAPAGPEGEDEEDDDEDELDTPAGGSPEGSAAGEGGHRRRRRRKRKHSEPAYNPRVLQLAALFLMLALVVWLLLRRMNQFPEGTVIDHGRLDTAPIATEPLPRCAGFDKSLEAFDRPPANPL